ncbi:fimbrial protein [Ectopseudomonas mendocina]|uniref:Fimbrial protein n=1 Tax=Ectopseudomonas mendocina TaxID=300 RepID=A0ABZ2RFB3_ECTME
MSVKSIKVLSVLAASMLASSVMANDGTLNFRGEIVAASCELTGGSGTVVGGDASNQIIDIDMGKVSVDSIANAAGNGSIAASKNINLNLDCGGTGTGLTSVNVAFDPASGSGYDATNSALLALEAGGATGVGIGLYDTSSKLIDLRAGEYFTAPLVEADDGQGGLAYTADLNIRASYVANGDATIEPGLANATLPFTITYQ